MDKYRTIREDCQGAGLLSGYFVFAQNVKIVLDKFPSIITLSFARLRWMDHGNSAMYFVQTKCWLSLATSSVRNIDYRSLLVHKTKRLHMINGWEKMSGSPNAIFCA